MAYKQRNFAGGRQYPPIQCYEDKLMIEEGLRPKKLQIDRKCFKKESAEKNLLKEMKKTASYSGTVLIIKG